MSIEEFITKVSALKDVLAVTSESLKESEIILIMLGALGEEYESFVTSITTRYDTSMTFAMLCELLMDQDLHLLKKADISLSVNAAVKSSQRKPDGSDNPKSVQSLCCQICELRENSALNFYNRLNIT